jgi:hypothetical protein
MPETIIEGRAPSPEKVQRVAQYQAYFGVIAAMQRTDDYAKWIFGGATTVAGVAALFSFTRTAGLGTSGRFVFGAAILCLCVALACSARALAPSWSRIKPDSYESMARALAMALAQRRWNLRTSAAFFAACLGLAGLAPLVDFLHATKPAVTLSYEFRGATLDASVKATDVPDGWARLELLQAGRLIASSYGTPDASGAATVALKAEGLDGGALTLISAVPAANHYEKLEPQASTDARADAGSGRSEH